MNEEKQMKINIPESIDTYKVTLFWGLTITQVIRVFIATLFTGFGLVSGSARNYITMLGMFLISVGALLGIVEIRGRNFYRYILFIVSYYKSKPRVLIYHHYAASGIASIQARQLVGQKEDNARIFIGIFIALAIGLILLGLIAWYLFFRLHV